MQKLNALRRLLKEQKVDAILISNAQNRRYLTNFTGSAGYVLIGFDFAYLLVDSRYTKQAQQQSTIYEVLEIDRTKFNEILNELLLQHKVEKLGFESAAITYETYIQLQATVNTMLVPLSKTVEKIRKIKLPEEITKIKKAAKIADLAFTHICQFIQVGITEVEIANELETYMRKNGATSSSFDMIIASGKRSALPHGMASSKKIETGDFVILDFGALYEGYRSDMTRTIAIGQPSEKLAEIYNIVQGALNHALSHLKEGMSGKEADALTRLYIDEKGYGSYYTHGSGHGIGLDIHEDIFMSKQCEELLERNMVLTVEPGIYLDGIGGVRIEDDVLILEDGVEVLTNSPKHLIILN